MLDQIKVVLVGTSHSGNIGSAARAMKVMGLTDMVLVDPQCEVDAQTIALAAGASEIALEATVVSNLDEAVKDCSLVVGTSARSRTLPWPMLDARECGEKLVERAQISKVAVVFGRERTGLTNDELQQCHYHVAIPANPEYSSLNLAMAVQTLCYEIRMAMLNSKKSEKVEGNVQEYPRHEALNGFFTHLQEVLIETEFLGSEQPGKVMDKLKRMFLRAQPETQELNILRGVLTAFSKALKQK